MSAPRRQTRMLLLDLWQDMAYTAGLMRKERTFFAAAALMLALGIGATTAIFTVVKGVLLDPLPYPSSDELVRIVHSIGGIQQPYFVEPVEILTDNR